MPKTLWNELELMEIWGFLSVGQEEGVSRADERTPGMLSSIRALNAVLGSI